jgi:hypothetical protein
VTSRRGFRTSHTLIDLSMEAVATRNSLYLQKSALSSSKACACSGGGRVRAGSGSLHRAHGHDLEAASRL